MSYDIRRATEEDAHIIAAEMRDYDRDEVWASNAHTPLQALENALELSDEAYTLVGDGIPFTMLGVVPYASLGGIASPWMLSSHRITEYGPPILKWTKTIPRHWLGQRYQKLVNFIDARHTPALRWAKWVGFQVRPAKPHGPFKMPFHMIIMSDHDV